MPNVKKLFNKYAAEIMSAAFPVVGVAAIYGNITGTDSFAAPLIGAGAAAVAFHTASYGVCLADFNQRIALVSTGITAASFTVAHFIR